MAEATRTTARLGAILTDQGACDASAVEAALAAQRRGDPRPLGAILLAQGSIGPAQLAAALTRQRKETA